jgi:DNA-binding NarL/FixJ family response regulator
VHIGLEAPEREPSSIILCVQGVEDLSESVNHAQQLNANAAILVFGFYADITLARAAFQFGARGFVHAGMTPNQVARAVMVAANGESVAPRELLRQLIMREDPVDLEVLSVRQQEILQLVVEGLSNAGIAKRLYLSESTIKQHLRAAYKLLGVKNRTQAARLIRSAR